MAIPPRGQFVAPPLAPTSPLPGSGAAAGAATTTAPADFYSMFLNPSGQGDARRARYDVLKQAARAAAGGMSDEELMSRVGFSSPSSKPLPPNWREGAADVMVMRAVPEVEDLQSKNPLASAETLQELLEKEYPMLFSLLRPNASAASSGVVGAGHATGGTSGSHSASSAGPVTSGTPTPGNWFVNGRWSYA